MKETSCCF